MKRVLLTAMVAMLAACEARPPDAQTIERNAIRQNQNKLLNDTPLPKLVTSLERKNLAERLERINQDSMSGCVYLISYGTVMAFYPVRGKVSSMKSYLTPPDRITTNSANGEYSGLVVEAPDLDGAYGDNVEGIFFFTADSNTYVEWAGEYLFTDQCLALNQQPKLIRTVK